MNLQSFSYRNIKWKLKQYRDKFQGLDFLSVIEPEEVGLDPNLASHSSPSGNKFLENVLNDLNITSKDTIIDIGCGKGSAMRTMLKYDFGKVDGIELSEKIANIATNNFRKLNSNNAKIFCSDAALFTGYDVYNMIYFYNPFLAVVMKGVVDKLTESVKRADRELTIIYNNAACHDLIINTGNFIQIGSYPDQWKNGMFVYSNRSLPNSRLAVKKLHH